MYGGKTLRLDESKREISIHEGGVSLIAACLVTAFSWRYQRHVPSFVLWAAGTFIVCSLLLLLLRNKFTVLDYYAQCT